MPADKQFASAAKTAIHEIDAARHGGMNRRAAIRHVARRRRLPKAYWPRLAELYSRVKDDI